MFLRQIQNTARVILSKKYSYHLLIFLLAFLSYVNTLSHDYAWDDTIVILENDRVQQGLDDISIFFKNIKSEQTQHRYGYRPITLLSFAVEYEYFGLNPTIGHITNVLLYSFICCLLFVVLRRLFPKKNKEFFLLITLLFIVHPIHTEVVANIKSRDELLTVFFGLLSMLYFLNFLEREKRKILRLCLSLLFLLIAFLSRENGVVFIGLLLLVAYYRNTKKRNSYFVYGSLAIGFVVLLVTRLLSTSKLLFQDNSLDLAKEGLTYKNGFLGNPLIDASGVFEILPNSFLILLEYIKLLIFPYPLRHDYGYGHSYFFGWGRFWVWGSILLHLILLGYIIKNFKKKTILIFGILFYFITVSIYLHIFSVAPDYMAERYLFLPSIGFCIVVVSLIERVIIYFSSRKKEFQSKSKSILAVTIIFIVGIFMFATINRNKAWKNNYTLFSTDIVNLSNCARANYNYASVLRSIYDKNPSEKLKAKILEHYQKSVSIANRSVVTMLDLGNTYLEFGYPDKAKNVFEKSIEMYLNVATPYLRLGQYYISQNEYDTAGKLYLKAIQNGIKNTKIYYMYSVCLLKSNQVNKAFSQLKIGLELNPNEYVYFELLSDLAYYYNQKQEAKDYLQKAIKLAPENQKLIDKLKKLIVETAK